MKKLLICVSIFFGTSLFGVHALNEAEIQSLYIYTDCFTISKPVISNVSGNLLVTNTLAGVSYNWYINGQIEGGQTSPVHTSPLVNANYQVKAANSCVTVTSDEVGIFRKFDVTTVTVQEIITITNCDLPVHHKGERIESSDELNVIPGTANKPVVNIDARQGSAINRVEITNPDGGLILSILAVPSVIDFANKPKGTYILNAFDKKGNTLKTYKIRLE